MAKKNNAIVKFPLGKDNFTKLRNGNNYYIDKTMFIKELVSQDFEVNLITRPRRFGKSLAMSMLEDFFDISRNSSEDFEGLAISEDTELCAEWMNQWPVISLSLKDVEGETFEEAYGMFTALIANLCKCHSFLAESSFTNPEDNRIFRGLMGRRTDIVEIKNSIQTVTRMMNSHYKKPAIVLIDEYDVPLSKAEEKGYYKDMVPLIRSVFSTALKSNKYLKFAVVTGCLKISKESIFTGVNHFVSDTITSSRFDEYIGFTKSDVEKIFTDIGHPDCIGTAAEWYDGYHFGSVNVYCPWDVLCYAKDVQTNKDTKPEMYWEHTSGNSILRWFLRKSNRTTKSEIEYLVDGGSVFKELNEQLTYSELDKSAGNLWSVLYSTGYLTQKGKNEKGETELAIPNKEIRMLFVTQIYEWFNEEVVPKESIQREKLCEAFKNGNATVAEKLFQSFLGKSISIRDTFVRECKKENFYHGILLGIMIGCDNWEVRSNSEDGDGYSDIHVENEDDDTAFVIEVKYSEDGGLDRSCKKAMEQIEKMKYAESLCEKGFGTVYAYGIACYKRRCKVVCKSVKKTD